MPINRYRNAGEATVAANAREGIATRLGEMAEAIEQGRTDAARAVAGFALRDASEYEWLRDTMQHVTAHAHMNAIHPLTVDYRIGSATVIRADAPLTSAQLVRSFVTNRDAVDDRATSQVFVPRAQRPVGVTLERAQMHASQNVALLRTILFVESQQEAPALRSIVAAPEFIVIDEASNISPEALSVPRSTPVQATFDFPDTRITPRFDNVMVDRIAGRMAAPTPDFVENIATLGIMQPVVLIQQPDGTNGRTPPRFHLVAGRRRVGAATALGMTTVPAVIYPPNTPRSYAAAMALSENVARNPNFVSDLEAIESMVRDGANEADIAERLSLPVGVLRQRMRLAGLIAPMRDAARRGDIPATALTRVAGLTTQQQNDLLAAMTLAAYSPAMLRRVAGDSVDTTQLSLEGTEAIPLIANAIAVRVREDADALVDMLPEDVRDALRERIAPRVEVQVGGERLFVDARNAESAGRVVALMQSLQSAAASAAMIVGFDRAREGADTTIAALAPGERPNRAIDRRAPSDDPEETGAVPRFTDAMRTAPVVDVSHDGDESWERVVSHLESAARALPLSIDDATDRFYQSLTAITATARMHAAAEVLGEATPAAAPVPPQPSAANAGRVRRTRAATPAAVESPSTNGSATTAELLAEQAAQINANTTPRRSRRPTA